MAKQTPSPSPTAPPAEDDESVALWLDLYRQMVLVRKFEDAVQSLFLRGHVYGSTHLCVGQEAVSVGVCSAIGPEDWISSTYRGHGNVLGAGTDPQQFLDELMGRATGICGGRAGSMNVVDLEHRLIGCFGIIGASLGAATGVSIALRGTGAVAVGFFGDGSVNQAYFYECLNFAKVNALPVLFVCENNGYGEYTPMELTTPGGILPRPLALEIPAEEVDGQDVRAVRRAAQEALAGVRAGDGPRFLEVRTYRYSDHGRGDPVKYRPQEEIDAWKKRDPLIITRRQLVDEHGVSSEAVDEVDAAVDRQVEELRERAINAPFPDPSEPVLEFAPSGRAA